MIIFIITIFSGIICMFDYFNLFCSKIINDIDYSELIFLIFRYFTYIKNLINFNKKNEYIGTDLKKKI